MSSPSKETEEPSSSGITEDNGPSESGGEGASSEGPRPPAKRRISSTVIEISDTESDDSDICAVTSYQASADEVKRIRGADYSSTSSSSSSDYSSDSEGEGEDDSVLIEDDKLSSKVVQAQLFPRANRMEDPKLNSTFNSQELIDSLKSHWSESKDLKTDEVTLTCKPFRLCLLHDLLANSDIINNIVDDMNTLDWSRKKMDLYEFHQTADLANLTWQRSIRGIYELLKTEVMTWVSSITGLQLSSVSASCSLYGPGDHLLVHDDLLGDRRVAFILYLAPWSAAAPAPAPAAAAPNGAHAAAGWAPHMGGALELLDMKDGAPADVTRTIYPQNNMLAFFKVGTESYHQVGEVLSMELPRLSINGWFHGPAPGEPPPEPEPWLPPDTHKPHHDTVVLSSWLSPSYMSPRARLQIQQHMERHSEAALLEVFESARAAALLAQLRGERGALGWRTAGPAHRRRYQRLDADDAAAAGGPLLELVQLMTSGAFVRLIADCTDLHVSAYHSLEIQRWRAGDFSLLPAREQYARARLEAAYWLGGGRRAQSGGARTYVSPEEGGDAAALVATPPAHNALTLVYCDPGAAAFTKYLSKLSMKEDESFYVLACTFTE